MPLGAGTRLGPYEILASLAQGGMGEVFRARDTRLDRTVAIKVLTSESVADDEARRRLHAEARAVSQLNHPNICTLHDIGSHEGTDYLVMELLQGETLAERLRRGAMPLDQVLQVAIEITQALDAAHAHGIVHRDLKPANVMLTKSGSKLLDFGIAKIGRPAAIAQVDTRTLDRVVTAEGVIVGTLPYMAPEQIEGEDIDLRADIFAIGAVLYEMATGQRAFDGKTQTSVTAAILARHPAPPSSLQPAIPAAFDRLVARCLAKNPEERWQSVRDILFQLRSIAASGFETASAPQRSSSKIAWAAAALMALLALLALVLPWGRTSSSGSPGRFHISLPDGTALLPPEAVSSLALSPDGSQIAFTATRGGRTNLWVRALNSLEARIMPGTEEARVPFWSADGRDLGFFAYGRIMRVDPAGGPPHEIAEAPIDTAPSWGPDGTILFALTSDASQKRTGGIYRVPAEGGSIAQVTTIDALVGETEHYWPVFLPDGIHFLYTATIADKAGGRRHTVYVASLADRTVTRVDDIESRTAYAQPGYLLYGHDGALLARPFDATTFRFTGAPVAIADRLWYYQPTGLAQFAVSDNGVAAFHGGPTMSELLWFDRSGRQVGSLGNRASYHDIRISHDGRKVAVATLEAKTGAADIWIYDRESGIPTRFTSEPVEGTRPVWSHDDLLLFFRSTGADGPPDMFQKRSDGRGEKALMLALSGVQQPMDATPDGRQLVYSDGNRLTGRDIWLLPLAGTPAPVPYLRTDAVEHDARVSPDGRWLAFVSSESGLAEVYVAPIDDPGARRRVSSTGGIGPRWGRDGRELVYLDLTDTFMSVELTAGPDIKPSVPRPLFSAGRLWRNPGGGFGEPYYDLSPDGQTFLINRVVEDPTVAPITVFLNWPAALEGR